MCFQVSVTRENMVLIRFLDEIEFKSVWEGFTCQQAAWNFEIISVFKNSCYWLLVYHTLKTPACGLFTEQKLQVLCWKWNKNKWLENVRTFLYTEHWKLSLWLIFLFLLHTALQEPVVDSDARQPGAGASLLVERVLLRQTCGWISEFKTLELRHIVNDNPRHVGNVKCVIERGLLDTNAKLNQEMCNN